MPEPDERKRPKKRIVLLVVLGVAAAVGAAFGVPRVLYALHHESTDDAFVEGTIASVSFRISGHVQAVHVDDNERVPAGAPIAELDPASFEVRLHAAAAALEAARAKLQGLEARVRLAEQTTAADVEGAAAAVDVAEAELAAARTRVDVAEQNENGAGIDVKVAAAERDEALAAEASARASAELDATDLERSKVLYAQKTITKAELDRAEAASRVSAAKLEAAGKMIAAARARLEQASTRVAVAKSMVTQEKAGVDRAQAALEAARAKQKSAKSATLQVEVAKAERDEQRAEVEGAEADLAQARLDLGYTKLVAPVAGRVTKKSLTVGQWVEPGQALMALVPDDVWVVANYKETQVGDIHPGQTVRVQVDAFPEHDFRGRVDSIQAGTGSRFSLLPAENATGNYVKVVQRIPVKIVFDPAPDLDAFPLSPGMSVQADADVD